MGTPATPRTPGPSRPPRRLRSALALLVLVLASVGFAAGLFEVGLRLAGYQAIYDIYSKPSLFWRHDPLLGWSHEPGASGTYIGPRPWPIEFRAPVRINSMGLRGPEVGARPPDGYRVLFLGDSTVAAFEVRYEESFVARIGAAASEILGAPVEMINAGVRGYGTDQSYLYYRERGRQLEPDLVIFAHAKNDPEDNVTLHRMRRPFGKPAFALVGDGLLERVGHPIPAYRLCSAVELDADYVPRRIDGPVQRGACWVQTRLSDRSALMTYLTLRVRQNPVLLRLLYDLGSPERQARARTAARAAGLLPLAVETGAGRGTVPPEHRYVLTAALLRRLASTVRADGSGFVVFIDPREREKIAPYGIGEADIEMHELLVRSSLLDNRMLSFRRDAHLNAMGHRLYARLAAPIVADLLRRR